MRDLAPTVLAILVSGGVAACTDVLLPPDIPLESLLAVPETTAIGGRSLRLHADLWRDFMPGPDVPPGGRPLQGMIYVEALDASALPPTLNADAVWLVNVNRTWRTWISQEEAPADLSRPDRIVRFLRGGPSWGPSIAVDVVVRVVDAGGESALVRASEQWIWSTE